MNVQAMLRRLAVGSCDPPTDPVPTPDDHAVRRARIVAALTLAVGAAVLWVTLRIAPGDAAFYPATLALAAIWAIGGLVGRGRSTPLSGRSGSQARTALRGFAVGIALVSIFIAGALVVAHLPLLREPVERLLDHARFGSLPVVLAVTVLNGIVEEIFFRGTLYNALPQRWAIAVSAVIYAVVTAVSGVALLVLAAMVIGVITAFQRRYTGGVLMPVVTHITWSSAMLLLLPLALNSAT